MKFFQGGHRHFPGFPLSVLAMKNDDSSKTTLVGDIHPEILAYTAGDDILLDPALLEVDCLGTAAHVMMLSAMDLPSPILTPEEAESVVSSLVKVIQEGREGSFEITLEDQDVHLAVERRLTDWLGNTGKKVHTGRSRNDQVALDLRLFGRNQLLDVFDSALSLIQTILAWSRPYENVPMVGRTHMQPAMPSSVALWATSYAEGLLEDLEILQAVYQRINRSPLGSAAGYGVPLPVDRKQVSDLLGFDRPVHNVIHAGSDRGKLEYCVLSGLNHIMISLSRLAQDLVLFTLPEFGYFRLPSDCCTGSSIMPQKQNPDGLEMMRAKAARFQGDVFTVAEILRALPSGYNRDVQETKAPYMRGFDCVISSIKVMERMMAGLTVNQDALTNAFDGGVFATDQALMYVAKGMPFRDAYFKVKASIADLHSMDPVEALEKKTHEGTTAGLNWDFYDRLVAEQKSWIGGKRETIHQAFSSLLGVSYPELS